MVDAGATARRQRPTTRCTGGVLKRDRLWLLGWLVATIVSVTVNARPFAQRVDSDEVYWIGQAYYYHLAFEERDWRHPDWQLVIARENPPVAKYIIGAGIAVSGFHVPSIDLVASFSAYYRAQLGVHPQAALHAAKQDSVMARMSPELRALIMRTHLMYMSPDLLRAGRQVALACTLVASLLMFLFGASIAGPATGLVASQLLLWHPSVVDASQLAMSDAPALMLGVAAGFATWHCVRDCTPRRAVVAGILLGLAAAAKMNWVTVAVLFAVAVALMAIASWRRGDARRAGVIAAAGAMGLLVALATFIAINPTIINDPAGGMIGVVREHALNDQVKRLMLSGLTFLSTIGMKSRAVASLVAGVPWAFALALLAVGYGWYRARRPGASFAALWLIIALVCVTAWIPVEWARYVMPVLPALALLAAHALVEGGRAVVRWARPSRMPVPETGY